MSEKPKRPWFRFHLLTAMLMMLSAGAFLGLNLKRRPDPPFAGTCQGWPLVFEWDFTWVGVQSVSNPNKYSYSWKLDSKNERDYSPGHNEQPGLMVCTGYLYADITFAIFVLIGTTFISEYLIRRREGRKP